MQPTITSGKGDKPYQAEITGLGKEGKTTVIGEGYTADEAKIDAIKKAKFFTSGGRN